MNSLRFPSNFDQQVLELHSKFPILNPSYEDHNFDRLSNESES